MTAFTTTATTTTTAGAAATTSPQMTKDKQQLLQQQQQQHQQKGQQQQTTTSSIEQSLLQIHRQCRQCCGVGVSPRDEKLAYDYTYDALAHNGKPQPAPRLPQRGQYYIDSYNGQSWSCSFGTREDNGIWMNSGDQAGVIMSALVWLLMLYSSVTVTALTVTEGIPVVLGLVYCVLCFLALACHAKTSLTDPGSVPRSAVPCEAQRQSQTAHSMCGQCQTFKPPQSHHCRICNRCVSRMDHHCPWMNNCVGAANLSKSFSSSSSSIALFRKLTHTSFSLFLLEHFVLFLIYTWLCSAYSLTLFGWNYFFCADEDCTFHPVVVHLVRVMGFLCVGAFLFTSSMLMNVTYGIMTGIGTIDRLKKKATNTMSQSDEEPISLKDVFGVAGYHTWPLPIDPVFENYDKVMGYSMPQRLAREQQLLENQRIVPEVEPSPSGELPSCVTDMLPV